MLFSGRAEGDLGRTSGATSPAVAANRDALLERCGVASISVPAQVHGTRVLTVAEALGYVAGPEQADAIATRRRGSAVGVHVADCLPIAIAGAGGVAIVHGGWRGLAGGVIAEGVKALRGLGVEGSLEAAIGPGAGGCCYEVGPELHELFAGDDASHEGKLDLPAIAAAQLERAGVAVAEVGICTLCAPAGLLFSHRRDGAQTGRQAGIAWLR